MYGHVFGTPCTVNNQRQFLKQCFLFVQSTQRAENRSEAEQENRMNEYFMEECVSTVIIILKGKTKMDKFITEHGE